MAEGVRETKEGILLEVRVKTNSHRFALYEKGGRLILEVTSPPREGEANIEIVKGLKKLFKKDVELISGFKSKEKTVLVRGMKNEGMMTYIA